MCHGQNFDICDQFSGVFSPSGLRLKNRKKKQPNVMRHLPFIDSIFGGNGRSVRDA